MLEYKQILEFFSESGVTDCLSTTPTKHEKSSEEGNNGPTKIAVTGSTRCIADKITSLEECVQILKNFKQLPISLQATNTVVYDGNPTSDILFIGEAPGANEDKYGIPFCGLSGKLLNNILLAFGRPRETVFITNTVFWRPPGNRRPTAEEILVCRPFVEKIIALGIYKSGCIIGDNCCMMFGSRYRYIKKLLGG